MRIFREISIPEDNRSTLLTALSVAGAFTYANLNISLGYNQARYLMDRGYTSQKTEEIIHYVCDGKDEENLLEKGIKIVLRPGRQIAYFFHKPRLEEVEE